MATWKSTGIVGLRDRGLKEIPDNVSHVGDAAKVLDITNNRIEILPLMLTSLSNLNRLVLSTNLIVELPGPLLAALAPNLKILVRSLVRHGALLMCWDRVIPMREQ